MKYELKKAKELEELLGEIIETNELFGGRAEFVLHLEGGKYPLCIVTFWINRVKVVRYVVYLAYRHRKFQQNSFEEIRDRIHREKENFYKYGKPD